MPRYDYDCPACGTFSEMRPMAAYAEPCQCPACGGLAPRAMAAARIGAAAKPASGVGVPASRRHRVGCGCCTPAAGRNLRADAIAAAAPSNGRAAPAGSFLTRG